ncbi:gamma-glutamyltransferase [Planctomycetaceae bacterium SH139]
MNFSRREWLFGSGAILASGLTSEALIRGQEASPQASTPIARGRQAAIATVSDQATRAGLAMFEAGGNAADAAVAAGLMLAVVDGQNSGLGGGCFILAHSADGRVTAIDGREMAPSAAHAKMFFRNGKPVPQLSQVGALAAGVPGAVAAYHALSTRLGTGKWAMAARLAAEVAGEGFPLSQPTASRLRAVAETLRQFPAARALYFDSQGQPLAAGERLVQPDLANTLNELATDGPDAFYQGRFAELTDRWMRANGGLMTQQDIANYRAVDRQPVRTKFHEYELIGFPPPSSGGVHVGQILSYLEPFDLANLASNSAATYYHVVAEAMRLAFADRAVFLGDPDFADVPLGLLDPQYLASRAALIHPERRIADVRAGLPPAAMTEFFPPSVQQDRQRHTTHFTAADAAGNWVAITATVNTSFGCKVVIPGTGVVLNNQMDDFAIAPGVPNAFGLVGAEANAPAAGKRPLSSMSPTLAMRGKQPVMTCGAAGGPRIISATAQLLLRVLACGMPLEEAMAAPRVHHQWRPDKLLVERTIGEQVVAELTQLGHQVDSISAVATAQGIARDEDGQLIAAAESRLPGSAASR